MIKHVVMSCNVDANYLEFWPLVARGWRRLLDVQVHLAVVSEPTGLYLESFPWSVVHFLKPLKDAPLEFQGSIARLYVASMLPSDHVVMLADMDVLPLRKAFVDELLTDYRGFFRYFGVLGPDGIEPTPRYAVAESGIFNQAFRVKNSTWEQFVQRNADRTANTMMLSVSLSSSLMTELMQPKTKTLTFKTGCDQLDLNQHTDVELPKPLHNHRDSVYPIAQYLGIA